jgi:gliding motility-associated-like protein
LKKRFCIFLTVVLTLLFNCTINAQLCTGSLGDPIVNITFGSGANPGPALSAATTAYQFLNSNCPNDGFYTVRSNITSCFNNSWHLLNADHTGNLNGYIMLVNASIQPNDFYVDTVRGLCANSTYEFAAWLLNVILPSACGGNTIRPNITFTVEKLDGTILQTYNTGDLNATATPIWKQYGSFFTTPIGVSDVVLRMKNNATGGCGNDIALDDITFRPCGPKITPSIIGISNSTTTSFCRLKQGDVKYVNFNCTVSGGFNNPIYQWQYSYPDFGNPQFYDIPNETTTNLQIGFIGGSLPGTYKYRLIVSEAGNINSLACRIVSEPMNVIIYKNPVTTSSNNGPSCKGSNIKLTATGGFFYNWTGPNNFSSNTNPLEINNLQISNAGEYFVEVKDENGCIGRDSTIIIINNTSIINTNIIEATICKSESKQLEASGGIDYKWSPESSLTTSTTSITIAKPDSTTKYKVIVKNNLGCKDSTYITLNVVQKPIVYAGEDKYTIANKPNQINASIIGSYKDFIWYPATEISNPYNLNPLVYPSANKKYTLKVTTENNCYTVEDEMEVKIYNGIFIPNTFTPNADGKNDTWNIPALEIYPLHEITVFNRYGQIVFQTKQNFIGWDGTYMGAQQPAGVYTYIINLRNNTTPIKGTVLIVR